LKGEFSARERERIDFFYKLKNSSTVVMILIHRIVHAVLPSLVFIGILFTIDCHMAPSIQFFFDPIG